MRKFILLFGVFTLVILNSHRAQAQTDGKYLLNFNGSLMASDGDYQFAVASQFGIFNKSRRVAGGIEVGYAYLSQSGTLSLIEAGPFFRSYLYRNTRTGLFLGAGISYAFGRESDYINVSTFEAFHFGPDIGFNVFLSPMVGLEILSGYRIVTQIGADEPEAVFSTRLGVVLFL